MAHEHNEVLMQLIETLAHLFHPRRSNNHRPRVLHPEGFFSLAAIVAVFFVGIHWSHLITQGVGDVLGFASDITTSQVIAQTNQARASQGLAPLTVNGKLNAAAQAKAQYMFAHQFWAHVAPDGTQPWAFFHSVGYDYSIAGENLARDFGDTGSMVAAWLGSPTHRANIMNPRFHEIGVAVVNGHLLGTDTTLVVQLFGTQRSVRADVGSGGSVIGVQAEAPAPSPAEIAVYQNPVSVPQATPGPAVAGGFVAPISSFAVPPLFSPLQLMKAFFLAVIFIIIATLIYDGVVMHHQNTVRLVGKNFAHILLLCVVAFLLILFKGGIVQ